MNHVTEKDARDFIKGIAAYATEEVLDAAMDLLLDARTNQISKEWRETEFSGEERVIIAGWLSDRIGELAEYDEDYLAEEEPDLLPALDKLLKAIDVDE